MNQIQPVVPNRIICQPFCGLLVVTLLLVAIFDLSPAAIAQDTDPRPVEELVRTIVEATGLSADLVTEMLAAGIPAGYISQEQAEIFVTEMRQELALPTQSVDATNETATTANVGPAALENVRLRSCSSQNFPFVFLTLSVDQNGRPISDLTQSNFQCFENGILQTDLFQVTPPQSGDNVRLADIVFLIDASGSMVEEIADVRANVAAFANVLAASDIDFRLGLVQFGNGSGSNPFLFNNGNLTTDLDLFKRLIGSIGAGGGFEPGFLALRMATQGFNFRPGSQKVFVLISDEDSDDRNYQATVDLLVANSITVHTAVDCGFGTAFVDYCNSTSVRGVTDGLQFNVVGPYNQILDTIAGSTANTYILRYQSSNPNFDASTRTVECFVSAPAVQGVVSCAYVPGAAPQIALTTETLALNQQAIAEGSAPQISVLVTDQAAPFVQSVTLYYRTTGTTAGYTAVAMRNLGNNRYEATIPTVRSPGVDYYITATDGQGLSSLPSTDPGQLPFQIGVLPNVAPLIQHVPPANALYRAALPIQADVLDTTNLVATVELKWRRLGELIYRTVPMQPGLDHEYLTAIPSADVTTDLEYYLRAVDDLGVAATAGSADTPYRIPLIYGESPVIFIPGMVGSRLKLPNEDEDLWFNLLAPNERALALLESLLNHGLPGVGTDLEMFFAERQVLAKQLTLDKESEHYQKDMIVPDALRDIYGVRSIYGDMLNVLATRYQPYQLDVPTYTPGKDCDFQQAQGPNKPQLFVLPYDWRKSNVDGATLLDQYITECIQRYFYPNSKVNIVAHSMGGLIARRYILDHPDNHDVNKLITIATPWLGSLEFVKVLETGNWLWPVTFASINSDQLKALVETYPGAHELLPSDRYFQLVPTTFMEDGWDINSNGLDNEQYNPSRYQQLMDQQRYEKFKPVQVGRSFHNYPGQDVWASDLSGVEYHYIITKQALPTTITGISAEAQCLLVGLLCNRLQRFRYDYGDGDGTVPLVSARRALPATSPDGSNLQIHEFQTGILNRLAGDHVRMLNNAVIQECVTNILLDQTCPAELQPLATYSANDGATPAIDSAYYVAITGAATGIIEESTGKRTGSFPNGLMIENIDTVRYVTTGSDSFDVIAATTESYTLTLRTSTLPLTVEIIERTMANAVLTATRYRDIQLPPNTLVQILLKPQSDYHVYYDANNDGIVETDLPGTVAGTGAQDTTAPQLAVNSEFADNQLRVTMQAQDSGSGVDAIYYSLDGVNFMRYNTSFTVATSQEVLYAFADDNVSNRSALFTFPLIHHRYLPIISFSKPAAPVNLKPNLPANPMPASGATVAGDPVTLSWSGGDPDGDATTYDLYLDATSGDPTTREAGNLPVASYSVHGLTTNTQYAWRIVARDSAGLTTSGPVWRFITAPTAPLEVTISSSSTDQYKLQRKEDGNGLATGSLVYSDRGYLYDTVASSVQGATYVATANNDKAEGGLRLSVTVNKPVQLYIAFSDQATKKPSWLDPFQDTGEDLTFFSSPGKVVNLSLYRAVFPAGEIKLGENDPANDSHTMYTIVIKE